MAKEVNGYHCPEPIVVYDSTLDILEIRNGEASATSEEFARGVVVYFDKDSDAKEVEEPSLTVAVRFMDAEKTLKPFVDAILRQRGLEADSSDGSKQLSEGHKKARRPEVLELTE